MDLIKTLQKRGIAVFDNVFSDEEVNFLKEKFIQNCNFTSQGDGRRYGGKGGTVRCKYV